MAKMHTDLAQYSNRRSTTGPYADDLDVDVLVVGAGFGGVFCAKTLREMGLKVVIYEAGQSFGGTWRWNRYPGARVDSEVPEYEFSWPEVWKDWTWSTNYPNYQELREYFDHVDKVIDLSKDCSFETVVTGAQFDTKEGKWHVKTADGRLAKAKHLVVAAGFASKRYIPNWKGLDRFKGTLHHSSFWPDEGVDVKGKRCAVIGTGASGVQISQEWGPDAGELKVFQRTPNLAVPMGKRMLTPEEQNKGKDWYHRLYQLREKCYGGFFYGMHERNTFQDTPEEREAFYHKLWDYGGFRFWLGNYKDMLTDAKANQEAYNFWAKNVRARIGDARKRDILAPLDMPHYFGVKRPCLEQNYYEQFNRDNVDVIDIKDNPIAEFTETGIKLENGDHYEFDVIAIATGFDITTGGMTNMGLKSIKDTDLKTEWKSAANTYLGTTVGGYPNMFHLYGPHGPTLLSNGPSTVEVQGRWICDCIQKIERENLKYINPTDEAVKAWKKRINDISDATLFPTTRSTYMGGSIPGKAFEQVNYAGGIPAYCVEIRNALDGWVGFETVAA
ncbi:HK97 family phage prohead protease [Rhizodiscina lignyota]|uniref:HK97 family phage prohead protease n=1 Tax=Rhizodiscina lignyota TaxID=1504668 RepID=A0A9P4IHB9_9PEZI|nr:HK97 family phage prohead protease [Rhizodiscina lignyota]